MRKRRGWRRYEEGVKFVVVVAVVVDEENDESEMEEEYAKGEGESGWW